MFIAFDIGGTNMRLAASRDGKTFVDPIIIPTPKKFTDGAKAFIAHARTLAKKKKITAIGGGIAGPIESKKGWLANSPNLSGWVRKPLANVLRKELHAPVYIENDTAIVGLGEAVAGAGKNYSIVAYVTISTGVNGVRIVNKRIDPSVFGYEIGHQIISSDPSAPHCAACKTSGHLEAYISGQAVEAKYHTKPWLINTKAIWNELALWTARGLVNTAVYWSPEVIVLGGSMMKTKGIPLEEINKRFKSLLTIFPVKPKLVKATLGDVGGLYGGLAFIHQQHHQ